MSPTKSRRTPTSVIRQVVPWLLLIGILGFLFSMIPVQGLLRAFDRVAVEVYLALMAGIVVVTLLTDALGYVLALQRVDPKHRASFRRVLESRAASYVPSNFNYTVGQGALVVLFRRTLGVPIDRGVSVVLLVTAINLLVLCLLVGVGVLVGALPSDPRIRFVVQLVLVGAPVYLLVVSIKPGFLLRVKVIEPLLRVGLKGTLLISEARALHVLLWLLGHRMILQLFGVHMPMGQALVRLPLVFLVAAMPITPAGFGTGQAAAVVLLSEFAPGDLAPAREAILLAYSLSIQALTMILQSLAGVCFARRIAAS